MGVRCEFVPESVAGLLLIDAGVSEYEGVYSTQVALVDKKKKDKGAAAGQDGFDYLDYLIMVEHPDVYTYGRKSKNTPILPESPTFAVERGGEVTFHNVGQLVCYPILTLRKDEKDVHLHLRRLESTIIDSLKDFGLKGERRNGATGVWLEGREKKIASIGIAVSSWVTFHGSALNVNNDLSGFQRINPCGFSSQVMTSMQTELGVRCPSMAEVKESFLEHFTRHFNRQLVI